MAYMLGVALFALGILVSVCLHEAGHMVTAKAFGMKVTQYFAGFGPTLWSFRKGETEYGVKAIPLGGFVKIVGMTPQDDDVPPGEEHRAMWRFPVWKRTIVLSAGSITHFLLAFIALWLAAMFMGFPNPALAKEYPAYVDVKPCVIVSVEQRECAANDPTSPALSAQLQDGDKITALNGAPVASWDGLFKIIRETPAGSKAKLTYERAGVTNTVDITLQSVQRPPADDPKGATSTVAALGVGPATPPGEPLMVKYGPVGAIGASVDYSRQLVVQTFSALKTFPQKIPKLWHAITGGERDADSPISVVGASRLGGEAVENDAWALFVFLFIGLNFFVGIFNLLPLLPVDGGHIAIAWFEKARSFIYAKLHRPDPGRVDYYKLMPLTYVVILIFGGITLLTVSADIVNPVTLFPR